MKPRNVLILGASYGSLLGVKLALAGHDVKLVCLPQEAALAKGPPKGETHSLPMGELIHCHGSPMPAVRIWPPVAED